MLVLSKNGRYNAATKPITSNDTPDSQAKNRRVEIVIIEQHSR
ncbi:MAG: hypothetical protein ABIG09_03155 [bacterium]